MAVIPTGYAQANLKFGSFGLPHGAEVVLGYKLDSFAGDPTACATQLSNDFVAEMSAGLMANGIALNSILVKYGPNDTGPAAEVATPWIASGGAGGGAAVAILMHKNTGLGGRKGRGRSFWPGPPEAQIDTGGFLGSGVAAAWASDLAGFFAKNTAAGLDLVVLHNDATTPTLVTSTTVDAVVATQRRRQRR